LFLNEFAAQIFITPLYFSTEASVERSNAITLCRAMADDFK
jgi:hypothetical protein